MCVVVKAAMTPSFRLQPSHFLERTGGGTHDGAVGRRGKLGCFTAQQWVALDLGVFEASMLQTRQVQSKLDGFRDPYFELSIWRS